MDTLKQAEATIVWHCSVLSCVQHSPIPIQPTEMINGVLAPYFIQSLVADIGCNKYSLLLGTDVSASKYLGARGSLLK